MENEIYLTIEGEPEQEVQVWHRGNQSEDESDPAPIVFTGKLGSDGRITVRVPREYLCIGVPEKSGCRPHNLKSENGDSVTVSLKDGKSADENSDADALKDETTVTADSADHDIEAFQEAASILGDVTEPAGESETLGAVARPWRTAQSLITLRNQVNQRAPNRNRASDGTIGDSRHCSGNPRASDHCPWIIDGANSVVTAMDITNDPAHGCAANDIAEAIRTARDGRVKYIIWNRRICSSYAIGSSAAWAWRTYTGSNGHTQHVHISVKSDKPNYDSTAHWAI